MKIATLAILALSLSGCDMQDRAILRTVVDAAEPLICPSLVSLAGGSGEVCPGIKSALDLLLASSGSVPDPRMAIEYQPGGEKAKTSDDPAKPVSCSKIFLRDLDPRRDPKEYVCKESGITKRQLRSALAASQR